MGRPKADELKKAERFAIKSYLDWQKILKKDESDLYDARIHFVQTNGVIGRPPVPLAEQQFRAFNQWECAYSEYQRIASSKGVEPKDKTEFSKMKLADKAGRRPATDVNKLKRCIRRMEGMISDLEADDSLEVTDVDKKTVGRKGISRAKKISNYRARINDALKLIEKAEKNEPEHQIVANKLYDLRIERRQLRLFISNPKSSQVQRISHSNDEAVKKLALVEEEISLLELEYETLKEKAGPVIKKSSKPSVLHVLRPQCPFLAKKNVSTDTKRKTQVHQQILVLKEDELQSA